MTKIRFPDATVYVREVGEGMPLLLINGLGAHSAMWEPLEQALQGFRLLQFDLPGAGRSDVPWRPVSVRRLARLATSIMDHFGVEQAHVLGYSMGGVVAQQLAHDAPERVRRVVLVATTPGIGAYLGDVRAMLNILTPARYLSPTLYAKTIGDLVGGRARHDRAWVAEQGTLRLQHAPSWRGYLGQLQSISRWSGLPLLRDISSEVLVLTGDDDPLTPVVNAKMLTHLLPNGRMVVLPGIGHLLVMNTDSGAHPVICEFLTSERLDDAPVWNDASAVDADELRTALALAGGSSGRGSRARARRRWLPELHRYAIDGVERVTPVGPPVHAADPLPRGGGGPSRGGDAGRQAGRRGSRMSLQTRSSHGCRSSASESKSSGASGKS
jgi:poly(3-hydroxyoctanoate) depolymerase